MNNKQKDLWEKLAKSNSRYYINSDYGKSITEERFRNSGKHDYERLILSDELFDKGGKLIEIGCGTGRMTEFMAENFKSVTACDISGEMVKQARERVRMPNVDFVETDGNLLPFPDNSFDEAFSYLVFQHIKTKEMVESNFREIYKVLIKGGIFKVLLRAERLESVEPWWGGVEYDESGVDELCRMTGFTLLKLEYVRTYAMWLWLEK